MNYRVVKILERIFLNDEKVTITELAKEWNVSERTIYNDLNFVDDFLSEYSITGYELKNSMIQFAKDDLPEEVHNLIKQELEQKKIEIRQYSPEYRIKYIGFLILIYGKTTNKEIAEELLISTSTIKNDYKKLEQDLNTFNLSLHTEKFKGVTIRGNESNKRNFLIEIILNEYLLESTNEIDKFYQQYLDQRLLKLSIQLLEELSQKLDVQYVDKYVTYLYIAIYISLNRIQQKEFIEVTYRKDTKIYNSQEYELVKKYLMNAKVFDIKKLDSIDIDAEISFILDKIQTSSYYGGLEDFTFDNWLNLQFMVDHLIISVSNEYSSDRLADRQLYEELLQHLRPALNRLEKKMKYINPIKKEISSKFPDLTKIIKNNIYIIENYYKVSFSDDELSYVVLLFAASIKRNKVNKEFVSNVAVVCQEGISTSSILRSQLEQQFNIDVIDIYSKNKFEKIVLNNKYDYIISTVDLDLNNHNYLKVNTILSDEDKVKLNNLFTSTKKRLNVHEIIRKINPYIRVIDEEMLYKELAKIIGVRVPDYIDSKENEIMLKDVLTEQSIELNKEFSNAEEVVRHTGEVLKRQGLVEDTYIEAMVENMKTNGPYFVIAPGIAMPHARPETGTKGIGFSIVTLSNSVKFGHPTNDPVELVIGLCAVDHQSHLTALQELMEILSEEDNLNKIKNAKNKKEVLNTLRKEN